MDDGFGHYGSSAKELAGKFPTLISQFNAQTYKRKRQKISVAQHNAFCKTAATLIDSKNSNEVLNM
jgi:hypothetical protein